MMGYSDTHVDFRNMVFSKGAGPGGATWQLTSGMAHLDDSDGNLFLQTQFKLPVSHLRNRLANAWKLPSSLCLGTPKFV
jgi:hypothetical protein